MIEIVKDITYISFYSYLYFVALRSWNLYVIFLWWVDQFNAFCSEKFSMLSFKVSFICIPGFESEWAISTVERRFTRVPTQMFLKHNPMKIKRKHIILCHECLMNYILILTEVE